MRLVLCLLLPWQVNRSNLQSIVQQLLSHLLPDTTSALPSASLSLSQHPGNPLSQITSPSQSLSYRLVLSQRILSICSWSTYENVTNFEWCLSVLVDLAHIANVNIGAEIRDQLVDVAGRVRAARRYAAQLMYSVLTDDSILHNAEDEGSCSEILWAAGWIIGEYCTSVPLTTGKGYPPTTSLTENSLNLRGCYHISSGRRLRVFHQTLSLFTFKLQSKSLASGLLKWLNGGRKMIFRGF
jgi:hypothetical protein